MFRILAYGSYTVKGDTLKDQKNRKNKNQITELINVELFLSHIHMTSTILKLPFVAWAVLQTSCQHLAFPHSNGKF